MGTTVAVDSGADTTFDDETLGCVRTMSTLDVPLTATTTAAAAPIAT
jgi:hypothetical protein